MDNRPSLDEIFSQAPQQTNRPSLDDIFSSNQDNGPGVLSSAVLGGLNMGTFGYAPNLAGAIQHPIGAAKSLQGLTGQDISQDPDVAAYANARNQAKNTIDQAWEQHPYAYGTGALASAFLVPGAAELLPEKALAAAPGLAGAAYATGGGSSDLTKGQAGQFTKEAALGTVLGVGSHAALSSAGKAISPLSDKLAANSEVYQKLLNAFNKGQEGQSLIGPEAQKEAGQQLNEVSSDLANKLLTIRKQASDRIGDVVSDIKDLPTGSLMSDIGNNIAGQVQQTPTLGLDSEFNKFHSLYKKYLPILGDKIVSTTEEAPSDVLSNSGEPITNKLTNESVEQAIVDGKDLNNFKVDLNQLLGKTKDPNVRGLIGSALDKVDQAFSSNPEYNLANQDLKRLSSQFPELFLNKWVSKYAPGQAQEALESNIEKSLVKGNKTGFNLGKAQSNEQFDMLAENLRNEEAQNPGFLKSIGIDDLGDYLNNLKSSGQTFEAVSKIATQHKQAGLSVGDLINPLSYAKGAVSIGNPLGYGAKTGLGKAYLTANRLGKASNVGQKVFNMPNEALNSVVPILKNAGFDTYADMLQRGLDEGGQVRNSALFILLQQPQTRDILEQHSNGYGQMTGTNHE